MKYLPIALALFAAVTAFIAACIWKKASDAGNADYTCLGTEPGTAEGSYGYHMLATWRGMAKSGDLNKRAAYWTAASAILSLASASVGLWLLGST
jgi:hypothetical protein